MSDKCPVRKTSVGGEALIEGIMMRGPKCTAASFRLPDGSIETETIEYNPISQKSKVFRVPIIRGFINFIDSMVLGYKSLMLSTEKQGIDENEIKEEELSKFDKWLLDHFGDKVMNIISIIGMVLGLVLAFLLFFWLPTFLFQFVSGITRLGFSGMFQNIGQLFVRGADLSGILNPELKPYRALFEGLLRMFIFIAYIAIISRMKDIHRVFEYHGAEHKTIACYERGLPLTVENVKAQVRFHPRCGTSFIFLILIVSIIFSSILNFIVPESITNIRMLWIAIKILFLPFMMGIGYEIIKYAGKHDNIFVKIVSAPGLWLQRLTTQEPSEDGIIEIGIASLEAVITDNPEDDSI